MSRPLRLILAAQRRLDQLRMTPEGWRTPAELHEIKRLHRALAALWELQRYTKAGASESARQAADATMKANRQSGLNKPRMV